MFITKKHLSRRTFLRGATGAVVALPLLDAMVPALTAQSKTAAKPQLRFGAVYFPQGRSRFRASAGRVVASDRPRARTSNSPRS